MTRRTLFGLVAGLFVRKAKPNSFAYREVGHTFYVPDRGTPRGYGSTVRHGWADSPLLASGDRYTIAGIPGEFIVP